MRPKLTRSPWLLAAICTIPLAFADTADAYTLGAADGTTQAAPLAAKLGARTYRLVMDSTQPLESYAPRIDAYRALGMRPQLVIDGTGTSVRGLTGKNWQTINYAVKAFKRWPDAYSVSVMNEPDLSGIDGCQYIRTFNRAYRMLKHAGAPRVLFGEFSPRAPMAWTTDVLAACHKRVTADGFAWHCYDANPKWQGIDSARPFARALKTLRHSLSTPRGFSLPLFCTEYGVMTRPLGNQAGVYAAAVGDSGGATKWRHALNVAKRQKLAEIVAWGITEAHSGSRWDSSLVHADGTPRPAFAAIASR